MLGREGCDRSVSFTGRSDTGCKKQPSVGCESEATGKGDDVGRQDAFGRCCQGRRKRRDAAIGAEADIESAVGPEICPARVQARDCARVVHDASAGVQREDAIDAAIEIEQFASRVDAQASGIRDARVAAKDTEWMTAKIEGKGRSVPVAVWRRRTRHDNALFAHKRSTLDREASADKSARPR